MHILPLRAPRPPLAEAYVYAMTTMTDLADLMAESLPGESPMEAFARREACAGILADRAAEYYEAEALEVAA